MNNKWILVSEQMPELGIPVLGFNPEWIDEDFNPKGVRECWRNVSYDDDGYWIMSKWCNYHDDYHTGYDKNWTVLEDSEIHIYPAPTHWIELPEPPTT